MTGNLCPTLQLAEDILWKRLPSNAMIISALQERYLKHENSLPDMRRLLAQLGHAVLLECHFGQPY